LLRHLFAVVGWHGVNHRQTALGPVVGDSDDFDLDPANVAADIHECVALLERIASVHHRLDDARVPRSGVSGPIW
jgi:hypothetical protein